MEFENWLAFWFEEHLTHFTFMRATDEDLAGKLIKDMKQAGFEVTRR